MKSTIFFLFTLLPCLTLLSCGNLNSDSGFKEKMDGDLNFATFKTERAAWEAQGITAYRFTAQMLLNYPVVPIRITVKGNGEPEIEQVTYADFTEPDLEMATLYGKTISDTYASIEADLEKARNTPRDEHHRVGITLRYNAEYHYPEYYSACSYYDDLPEPGGSIGIEISDFKILDDLH